MRRIFLPILLASACASSGSSPSKGAAVANDAVITEPGAQKSVSTAKGPAYPATKKGDVVEVSAPRGALKFKILEIKAA